MKLDGDEYIKVENLDTLDKRELFSNFINDFNKISKEENVTTHLWTIFFKTGKTMIEIDDESTDNFFFSRLLHDENNNITSFICDKRGKTNFKVDVYDFREFSFDVTDKDKNIVMYIFNSEGNSLSLDLKTLTDEQYTKLKSKVENLYEKLY